MLLVFWKTFCDFVTKIDIPQLSTVFTEYREDLERLYGGLPPGWCISGRDVPDIYEVMTRQLSMKESHEIDAILAASNLSEDQFRHIKSIANKSVPGKWNPLELRIALGLVALAQVRIFISYPLITDTV